jgi:hypothetical protein
MKRIRELQEQQGWTDQTIGEQAIAFIESSALVDEFLCRLKELAETENKG